MPTFFEVCQTAHVALGACIVFAMAAVGLSLRRAILVVIAFAAFKEFVFDLLIEGDTILDGVIDSAFYLVGALGTACYLTLLCRRCGRPFYPSSESDSASG